ncbi:MAG TPA: stage II sporulation protein M [Clostridiaceae bacterium]|nr:stage II sporulation protein M [Clostridiaceae bacterium]
MLYRIQEVIAVHIKNYSNRYIMLIMALVTGISAGAFTVNGLSAIQREELTNYIHGFLSLMDNQVIDSNELLRLAMLENAKIVLILWTLGVMIIGIPFIFAVIGIKGFIVGFSSGIIIKTLGFKGILFSLFALLPKEVLILPALIAIGVNGMNFSINIIKNKSIKHMFKENLKADFFAYCFVTLFFSLFIVLGTLVEAYITPVLIRIISPIFTK